MKTTIDMAREVKATAYTNKHYPDRTTYTFGPEQLKAFEALVRADEREAFNKERQQYADWLDEAAADIEDWGMYASEYLQQKWDLPDQVQEYKNRAAAIRVRKNT
jgi:hypothetical protein